MAAFMGGHTMHPGMLSGHHAPHHIRGAGTGSGAGSGLGSGLGAGHRTSVSPVDDVSGPRGGTGGMEADLAQLTHDLSQLVVDWHWFVGVSLAVLAQFVSNLGLTLQKMSHIENSKRPLDKRRSMTLQPRWIFGMMLIALGAVGDFAALTFAAQSLVATLGSLTMVSNVVFARVLLGEVVTCGHMVAMAFILTGCVVVVAFGPHDSPVLHVNQVIEYYLSIRFILYLIAVFTACAFIYGSIRWIEREYLVKQQPLVYQYPVGVQAYHQVSYAALAGIVGAQSVLFGKGFAELLKSTAYNRGSMFSMPATYIIAATMVCTIFLQIKWLNSGIRRFGLLYVVPSFQTFWTVVSVVGGMLVYDEWKSMTPAQGLVFMSGIVLTVYGVFLLAHQGPLESKDKEEDPASIPLWLGSDDEDEPDEGLFAGGSHGDGTGSSGAVRRAGASKLGKDGGNGSTRDSDSPRLGEASDFKGNSKWAVQTSRGAEDQDAASGRASGSVTGLLAMMPIEEENESSCVSRCCSCACL